MNTLFFSSAPSICLFENARLLENGLVSDTFFLMVEGSELEWLKLSMCATKVCLCSLSVVLLFWRFRS